MRYASGQDVLPGDRVKIESRFVGTVVACIDTAAYLRAEMREHYRLRGNGVLENDECARGTGRILAQFDIQL